MNKIINEDERILMEDESKQISLISMGDDVRIKKEFYNHSNQQVYIKIMQNPHKNICEVFSVERGEEGFVVIEEFLGRKTLLDISPIKNIEEGYDILLVKHLHKLGIVHRDLKPENIYYIDGKVVVNDFDISKTIIKKKEVRQDTEVLGSVGYASPEQYGFSRSDQRADIYSIGIIINVLFTGALVSEHIVEGSLREVVLKCTQIHMGDRYQNISSLEKALRVAKLNKSKFTLPGFKTDKISTKVLSGLGYLVIFLLIIVVESENQNSAVDLILTKILAFSIFLLPVLVAGNYLNIKSLLPRQLRNIKVVGSFVLWLFLFVVIAVGSTMILSIFK